MHYILDNLSATLIAVVVVVLLAAMNIRTTQVSADRTALYAAKRQTLQFSETLSRELGNIGSYMPKDQRIGKLTSNTHGLTDTLQFWRVDSGGDTLSIEYILAPADTVELRDTTAIVYEMKRYQNGQLQGGSPPTLRDFRIDLLDNQSQSVGTNLEETRQVRIQLANVLPFGDPSKYYIPQTYWATTIRPNTLR